MKKFLLVLSLLAFYRASLAQKADTSSVAESAEFKKILDRDKAIRYQTGHVNVNSEVRLTVPSGYKFMSKGDAEFVVYDFWGNPRMDGLLGMIVQQDYSIMDNNAWAFIVSYEKFRICKR